MGCVSSKTAVPSTPPSDSSAGVVSGNLEGASSREILAGSLWNQVNVDRGSESGESGKVSSVDANSQSLRLGNLYRCIEGEQAAAGWPSWLSSVAKEAIHGWVPLKAESYEKLEKIGQGTYSSVFKARELETGRIVALKKVRFENYEPESVRFMAREIMILRRLNHPNIVKLEGIITARLSSSLYLVFEYMEHDLAGLSSAPDIKFSASQIKCYMHQLLSALEHCHSHGVMHRDIKCANLLVNNDGILKMADFGLANLYQPGNRQPRKPLTSRVVTLWYRPPELLLGSTDYAATVDLWSVGCVFAELFRGKPILQGRTEVEQIHKIFKLCGSPPEEYWKNTRLPHATVFKPHQQYAKCLRESFNFLPEPTFKLLETFLSLDPYQRGTAKSALSSEYFKSKPCACEPSSLPKYSPHKEIDAKSRKEAHRRRVARERGSQASGRPSGMQSNGQSNGPSKTTAHLEDLRIKNYSMNVSGTKNSSTRENGEGRLFVDLQPKATICLPKQDLQSKHNITEAHSFNVLGALLNSSSVPHPSNTVELKIRVNNQGHEDSKGLEPSEMEKQAMLKKWFAHPNSINGSSVVCHHTDSTKEQHMRDVAKLSKHQSLALDCKDLPDRGAFSGQFLTQSNKVDELLVKHEQYMRHAARKSWFQRGR